MPFQHILIVKLSAIGDVIHALPVAQALKQCYPACRITWIVEKPALDLLTSHPAVDEVIVFEKAKFKSLPGALTNIPAFAARLRQYQFDLVLDLQGLFKSGMISLLSGAATRLVYENAREGSQLVSKRISGAMSGKHVVERYLDVVRHLGCAVEKPVFNIGIAQEQQQQAQQIFQQAGYRNKEPYIVMALGANWPNKIWPAEYFALLSDRIYDRGLVPVVTGGPGDGYLLERLLQYAAVPPINLIGKTSLPQLAAIIRGARAFVGGDTGPMHLSAALNTPTVALMGPTDAERNGPYGEGHKVLLANRTCIGCWRRKCVKGVDCLAAISVEAVSAALEQLFCGEDAEG